MFVQYVVAPWCQTVLHNDKNIYYKYHKTMSGQLTKDLMSINDIFLGLQSIYHNRTILLLIA